LKGYIEFPVSNYYGTPFVHYDEDNGKYYLELENYNGLDIVEISKEFYKACKKEFGGKQYNVESH
jgi:hypothetical protein